jgi:hypothetical protein
MVRSLPPGVTRWFFLFLVLYTVANHVGPVVPSLLLTDLLQGGRVLWQLLSHHMLLPHSTWAQLSHKLVAILVKSKFWEVL